MALDQPREVAAGRFEVETIPRRQHDPGGKMTIVEFAQLRSSDGDEFAAKVQGALKVLANAPTCSDAKAYRCIEEPDAFIFAVTWDSVDAHHEFRAGPHFAEYRAHIQDIISGTPSFSHYSLVAAADGS